MFYDFSFLSCVLHALAVLISSSWRYKVKVKIYEALCCVILSLNSIPPRSKQLPNSFSAFPSSVLYPLVGSNKRPNVTQWDFAVRYVQVMAVFCLAVFIFIQCEAAHHPGYRQQPSDSGDTSFTLCEATCSERSLCMYITCGLCCDLIRYHIQGRLNFLWN